MLVGILENACHDINGTMLRTGKISTMDRSREDGVIWEDNLTSLKLSNVKVNMFIGAEDKKL